MIIVIKTLDGFKLWKEHKRQRKNKLKLGRQKRNKKDEKKR